MEADWSVALAADDPVITVPWASSADDARKCRFLDLRLGEHLIDEIEEARSRPALRSALLVLNSGESPLWTAKCDAWSSSVAEGGEPFDGYEMDAEPGETSFGAGSYVDLLPRNFALLSSFAGQERWIRMATKALRALPANAARVELVLRHAQVEATRGFGVTWFVEGCAATAPLAAEAWSRALNLALPVIMDAPGAAATLRPADDTMAGTGE
jgi:hypothetical protein